MNIKYNVYSDIEIEECKFHSDKNLIFFFEDKQIDNMLRCHKISYGEKNYKYFIGYMDDGHKIKSFSIILPKLSECGNI